MNESTSTWVSRRAKCSVNRTFNKIIEAMRRDVDEFNALPHHERGGRQFEVVERKEGSVVVGELTDGGFDERNAVCIEKSKHHHKRINISRKGEPLFDVDTYWSTGFSSCIYDVNNIGRQPAGISEKALADLLFPTY